MLTLKQLQDLLDPYYRESLDCDDQSRVLHYVFSEKEIKHKFFYGSIENKELKTAFPTHMWIELKAKEGPVRVDYKARKWLGENENNPHGVYLKEDYPQMIYRGSVVTEKPFPKHIIDQLLDTTAFVTLVDKKEIEE